MASEASPHETFVLLRVLVADSGSSVNDGLTALLSEMDGISVFGCAQDGDKLLALAGSLRPDAVILDVQRTEPVSLAILRRLKALPRSPIVIALYEDDIQPLREEIAVNGADYILARTDCEGLMRLLSSLRGNRSLSMLESTRVDILLVEDNPNDAELALRSLWKHKVANNIVHILDGEAALDYLFARGEYADRDAAARPKLILLDLRLPKVDGIEVLKAVKADDRTRLTPVVVLTSSNEERELVESYRLGVNSYIVKPVEFDKFLDAVKDLGFYWLLLNEQPLGARSSRSDA
jgi:two-component system, response regulator